MKSRILLSLLLLTLLACSFPLGPAEQEDEPAGPETGEPASTAEPTPQGAPVPTALPEWQPPETAPQADGPLNLPLQVGNPLPAAPLRAPVTAGVPLPQSLGLTDAATLRLVDAGGNPLAAQFTPLARWGAAPDDAAAPIRWLLVDFQVALQAGETAHYFLQQAAPAPPPQEAGIQISEEEGALWVDTGAARFRLDAASGVLSAAEGDMRLYGLADAAPGAVRSMQVVLAGPQRASLEVRGSFSQDPAARLDYTARYWFYAGSGLVRLFFTLENNTLCPLDDEQRLTCHDIGSPGSVSFEDLSLRLETGLQGSLAVRAAGEQVITASLGAGFPPQVLLYQDSSGTPRWDAYLTWQDWEGRPLDTAPRLQAYAAWRGYRILQGDPAASTWDLLHQGDQAGGWLSLSDGQSAWGAGVRDFWQNYPKALRATPDGAIEIALFPAEYGPEGYRFSLRAGEHKTHEIWLAPQEDLAGLLSPLFAQAPPQWYVDSGALGPTALRAWQDWPEHEQYIDDQLTTSPDHEGWDHVFNNLFDAIEGTGFYGIFDYGDWPIDYEGYHLAPLNPKYDHDAGMWLQWARGGDPRWFALAEAAGRHAADIDILHNLHTPRHWGDGIIFGHSYHDEDGFLNPHRNYGGSDPDTAYGMRGLLLLYYLTGYKKAHESALELAGCIAYRTSNDVYLCPYLSGECGGEGWVFFQEGLYDSNTRPVANSLSILTEAYRATADPRYLAPADAIVDWIRPERQPFMDGVTGDDMYLKPWLLNMYLTSLGRYLDMQAEFGRADTYEAEETLLALSDWLLEYAWLDLEPLPEGPRGAYPYEWWFDGRQGNPADEYASANNIPSVNNWLLLGADALAYAYLHSGNPQYLQHAASLFRAGAHDPFFEGDGSLYTETKQTINSIAFGHVFLHAWGK